MKSTPIQSMGHVNVTLLHLKLNVKLYFSVGRVFMSFTQLVQSTRHFLTGWNCKKVHMSKRISCAYGKCPNNKSYQSTCDAEKRRKIITTMKEQYGCPFEIR